MPTIIGRVPGFPTGNFEWDGQRLIKTYDDQWWVQADNDAQGPNTIVTALSIPIGTPFFDDLQARAKKVGPAKRTDEARLIWTVPIHYTTQFNEQDANDAEKRPDQRRLRKRWSFEAISVPFTKDAIDTDVEVVNAVDEPIEATTEFVIPVLTIERFEPGDFDPTTIINYVNHTNKVTFYGAPPKTALLSGIESEDDDSEGDVWQGQLFQRIRYVVKFKLPITEENKGWVERYVNVGTVYKGADGMLKPYMTDADPDVGKKEQIVGPLAKDGTKLPPGEPLVILQFNKSPEVDLNALQLGP